MTLYTHPVHARRHGSLDADADTGHNGDMKPARWIFPAALAALAAGFAALAAGCAAEPTPIRAYEARGVLVDVGEDRSSVVISHEAIANYMPAMEMPFPLAHPDVADGFEAGDEVEFHIVVFDTFESSIVHMEAPPSHEGPFPAFALEGLDGGAVTSAMLEGRVAIVNFWASWCAPCREEMPVLDRLRDAYREQGLEVVGIPQDPENMVDIRAQVAELGIDYPIAVGDGVLEEALGGVWAIPTTFVLTRDGRVADKHVGLVTGDALERVIRELL